MERLTEERTVKCPGLLKGLTSVGTGAEVTWPQETKRYLGIITEIAT